MGIRKIASPANTLIKTTRKLFLRKHRQAENVFFIEGLRIVGEALRTRQEIRHIFFCPEMLTSEFGHELIAEAEQMGLDIIETNKEVFNTLAQKENPQGMAAVVAAREDVINSIDRHPGVWIGLVGIQDPGNLGSIMRSADASGSRGIILLENTTDAWHPTAVRASMGAMFNQRIILADYEELRTLKGRVAVHMVGALSQTAQSYRRYNYPQNMILLLGSEQKGLPQQYTVLCDGFIHIPMKGSADSLNLANAASIILFEIMYQHERKKDD